MATSSAYGKHKVHDEWIPHKKLPYSYKRVRVGRAIWGEFRKDKKTGMVSYWAIRKQEEIVRNLQNGWCLDCDTVGMFRTYAVMLVGVVTDTGKTYTIPIERFHEVKQLWNYEGVVGEKGKGGARQWGVIGPEWEKQDDDDSSIEEAMKIGRFAK